jgi:hypothetical protein
MQMHDHAKESQSLIPRNVGLSIFRDSFSHCPWSNNVGRTPCRADSVREVESNKIEALEDREQSRLAHEQSNLGIL